ncbi:hypothetical protein FKM82_017779 [Ascaphus truei]
MTPDAEGSDPETDDNLSCDWSPEPATNSATRLYNGRLLTVLTYASRGEHLDQCLQNLRACGVQVSLEQCRGSLQISPLIPELCRYVFFSSRVFGMALALVSIVNVPDTGCGVSALTCLLSSPLVSLISKFFQCLRPWHSHPSVS